MMKRALLFLMVISIVLLSTACTGKKTSGEDQPQTTATESTAKESTATVKESDEITVVTCWWPMTLPTGRSNIKQLDTQIGALIAEETKLAFDITYLTGGDPEQAFNLKLASGNWEDVIICGKDQVWVEKLTEAGVIEPVESFYNQPDKYPNLAKVPQGVIDNFTFTDGHMYYFPGQWFENTENSEYGYWCNNGWYVHPDYLEAVNMTAADLATIEGVEKFLQAVKNANLKTSDGLPVLPISSGVDLSYTTTILTTFGVSVTYGQGFDIYDGELMNFRQHPDTKRAYEWMNKLYLMGVMDPEFTTQTNDTLIEKLMNRRIALMANPAIDFWNAVTAGKSPATELIYLPFPKVEGVEKLGTSLTYDPYGNNGWLLNKDCSNKEAVARAADWFSTVDEYRFWEQYNGPYGKLWDWSDKGEPLFKLTDPELIDVQVSGDVKRMEDFGYAFLPRLAPMGLDMNFFNENTQDTLFWIFDMHRFNVKQGYHRKASLLENVILPSDGAWAKNNANILSTDTQFAAKLITASNQAAFNAAWEEYQKQLETMGNMSEVTAEYTKAYNEQSK